MNQRKQFQTKASLVLFFLRGSKLYFALSILFACVVSLTDLLNPKIIEYTVDSVIGDTPLHAPVFVQRIVQNAGGREFFRGHLLLIAAVVLGIALIGAICRYLFMLFDSLGAESFVQSARDHLFSHIVRLPYAWHTENHTGDIIQRCTSDVETIKLFVSEQLMSLFRVVLLIVLSLYFMLRINWQLALAEALFIPVMVFCSVFFYTRIGSQFEKVDAEEGRLSSIAQENLTGVRVVRAFGRERFEQERFEQQNQHYTGLWFRLQLILASFWTSGNVYATTRNLVVTVLGVKLCVEDVLTAGGFIAFLSYNALISLPVRRLGRVITEMSKAEISIDRLRYIMNAEQEADVDPDADRNPLRGELCFEHVSFRYPGTEQEVLHDVSFAVKEGKTLGILGGTGSGKTTLMYLLDRLYDLDAGRITIAGTDIREIPRYQLRRSIGFVLQEPYLFSGTLQENIKLARAKASDEEMLRVSEISALDETAARMAKGYETYVGERGVTLSGGQRQRAAIAQMLIRGTPFMVFDDSLSAVDAETDIRIRAAMREHLEAATVVLIAHRITTLMQADEIIVLDEGQIVERGTHEELLARGGIYRRVYELQTRESE